VTIDIRNETLIGLKAAARMLPPGRRGRPVTLSCLFRWIVDGVKLPDGSICRLAAVRMGGRWLTSVESLQRFAELQTPRLDAEKAPGPQSPARRQRASERAGQQLDRLGM
jgi:hypothetical protein